MERSFLDREGLDPLPSVSLLSVSPLGRFTPSFLLVTMAFFFLREREGTQFLAPPALTACNGKGCWCVLQILLMLAAGDLF